MAATLSALKLPSLPLRIQSKLHSPSTITQTPTPPQSNPNLKLTLFNQQDFLHTFKSSALPLSTLALPFLLDAQVIQFSIDHFIFLKS